MGVGVIFQMWTRLSGSFSELPGWPPCPVLGWKTRGRSPAEHRSLLAAPGDLRPAGFKPPTRRRFVPAPAPLGTSRPAPPGARPAPPASARRQSPRRQSALPRLARPASRLLWGRARPCACSSLSDSPFHSREGKRCLCPAFLCSGDLAGSRWSGHCREKCGKCGIIIMK